MTIQPLKKMWVVVRPDGDNLSADYETMSNTKQECLNLFSKHYKYSWPYYLTRGWKCIKVEVAFTESTA